ncbi:hypothetical protein [Acinetobacter sp. MD2(2019)]|uniref:hypothetical protein n=1 Tax=Acinetobacter sp. MD2(2019) TaxID=2605273 RepID=UPI002D1EFB2C|nr:hypothetical protein [Acinetobacter sp. MD2(2019)]MEB3754641.1 hypothetical protein [Acinetobacter sp. MD2(2019)]
MLKFDKQLLVRTAIFICIISFCFQIYHLYIKPKYESNFEYIQNIAKRINQDTPLQVKPGVILDSASVSMNVDPVKLVLTLSYTLQNQASTEIDRQKFNKLLTTQLMKPACEKFKQDPRLQDAMIALAYHGNDHQPIASVKIQYSQCLER